MSNKLEYILSLNDQMSAKLSRIGIGTETALNKFVKLEKQSKDVQKVLGAMGGSVGSLRAKLDLLKAEKEWIPASNLQALKRYNREIQSLEREIHKLDTIQGSTFKQNLKGALQSVPFLDVITNPVIATGAALFKSSQMSMEFNKGMAAINTTAQLGKTELAGLRKELLSIDPKFVDDWGAVPQAYESIISQTGNVKQSTEILKASLKGAKGGFTDVTVVSAALAQSLSLIGEENANAEQVLDTFFAAKRVGAGEFKDFAQYMPSLIASGDALGVKYKEVAGMFAYMTGKGQSAERATVLMENAFSAMSKTDIRKNLEGAGINVFDEKGSIRSMTSIFSDLHKRMAGMSDEQKSSFLEQMGLVDKEARSAFIVMSSDIKKLGDSMHAVRNSTNEANKAFELSRNETDRLKETWSNIQRVGITLGGAISTVLNPALKVVGWVAGITADTLTWLFDGIASGNPVVIGLVAGVTALSVAMNWGTIAAKAQSLWLDILIVKERLLGLVVKAKAIAIHLVTAATWLWETATVALNAAWLASPIGLIVAGITALGAAVYGVTSLINSQTAAEKVNQAVKSRVIEKTAAERVELDLLFSRLKTAKSGTNDYKEALAELEQKYPGIIEKYDLHKGRIQDINKAQKELIRNLDLTAEYEANKELLIESKKNYATEKSDGPNWLDSAAEFVFGQSDHKDYLNEEMAKQKEYLKNMETLQKRIDQRNKKNEPKEADTIRQGKESAQDKLTKATVYNTEERINKRIKELTDQKSKYVLGSNEYNQAEHEIARLQNKLNPGKGSARLGNPGSRSNEAIASGGSKQTTVNVSFKNLIENIAIAGKDFRDSAEQLQQQSADALLRALTMAVTAVE